MSIWSLEKIASKVNFIFGFPFPSDSFNYDKGHPVVKIGNVKSGETDTLVDHDWIEKAKVIKGDIIFGMSGDFNISKWKSADALLNQRTCAIRNKAQDDYVSFLFYALEQPLKELNNTTQATMIKNLSAQQLRSLKVLMPDATTAAKIVTFLDSETSKIDSLADELTKFKANLLLQKRSLVSECVTKGIPSERDNTKFNLEKISNKVDFIFGFPFPSDSFNYDKGHPVVKIGNIKSGETDTLVDYEWVEKAKVVQGDIIFGMSGDFNISKWKSADALLNQRTCAIRNKTQDDYVSFLFYAMVEPLKELNNTTQSAMIKNLSAQQLRSLKVLMPSIKDANKIVDYLDAECARIDALIGEIDNQVNLLKTYRKSLINEVVTGKVEV